jgi:hypothetical protein
MLVCPIYLVCRATCPCPVPHQPLLSQPALYWAPPAPAHCCHNPLCTERHLPLPLPPAVTIRSVLIVLCFCKLTAAGLVAESNSAVFVLLNYKTNFQCCQSMFSAGLVQPDARISHSRCRPAMPIDGKNRKRILWLLHSLEHKYTFQPSFPPLPLQFSFHFYLLFFICDYWRDFDENERGTKKFSEIHQTRLAVRGRQRAQRL